MPAKQDRGKEGDLKDTGDGNRGCTTSHWFVSVPGAGESWLLSDVVAFSSSTSPATPGLVGKKSSCGCFCSKRTECFTHH